MKKPVPKTGIHENIRTLRKLHGLTLRRLGEELGVNLTTVESWERGIEPSLANVQRLAEYFGISVDELLKHHADANWYI